MLHRPHMETRRRGLKRCGMRRHYTAEKRAQLVELVMSTGLPLRRRRSSSVFRSRPQATGSGRPPKLSPRGTVVEGSAGMRTLIAELGETFLEYLRTP